MFLSVVVVVGMKMIMPRWSSVVTILLMIIITIMTDDHDEHEQNYD